MYQVAWWFLFLHQQLQKASMVTILQNLNSKRSILWNKVNKMNFPTKEVLVLVRIFFNRSISGSSKTFNFVKKKKESSSLTKFKKLRKSRVPTTEVQMFSINNVVGPYLKFTKLFNAKSNVLILKVRKKI